MLLLVEGSGTRVSVEEEEEEEEESDSSRMGSKNATPRRRWGRGGDGVVIFGLVCLIGRMDDGIKALP